MTDPFRVHELECFFLLLVGDIWLIQQKIVVVSATGSLLRLVADCN